MLSAATVRRTAWTVSRLLLRPASNAAAAVSSSVSHGDPTTATAPIRLRALFGSQTGTAEGFAREFADMSEEHSVPCDVEDLREFEPTQLLEKDAPAAVFFLACYGMGEPTDNARAFYDWLMAPERGTGAEADAWPRLRYAVFGLGNSHTHSERFCAVGAAADRRLEELGAIRLAPRVDADDAGAIELQFDAWQEKFLDHIAEENANAEGDKDDDVQATVATSTPAAGNTNAAWTTAPAPEQVADKDVSKALLNVGWYHPNTSLLHIRHNTELTPKSSRSTIGMEIDLPSGEKYSAGDHLAIYPTVPEEAVERVLARAVLDDLSPDVPLQAYHLQAANAPKRALSLPLDAALSLRQLLTHVIDPTALPSPKLLRDLAQRCAQPADAEHLSALASQEGYGEVLENRISTLDCIEAAQSLRLGLASLVTLPPVLSRIYSIASTPLVLPHSADLLVRVVEYPTPDGKHHQGLCSSFLAKHAAGTVVPGHLLSTRFKLPTDPATPVVMVAGGTGIAPFKAFVDERMVLRDKTEVGPMVLIYGVRNADEAAYAAELKEAQAAGVVQLLVVAHAEDGVPVDVALGQHAEVVWGLINQGAYVYVCGGASGFGPAVLRSVRESVLCRAGGLAPDAANDLISDMLAKSRLQEELSD